MESVSIRIMKQIHYYKAKKSSRFRVLLETKMNIKNVYHENISWDIITIKSLYLIIWFEINKAKFIKLENKDTPLVFLITFFSSISIEDTKIKTIDNLK
jgi:hypothetical protein